MDARVLAIVRIIASSLSTCATLTSLLSPIDELHWRGTTFSSRLFVRLTIPFVNLYHAVPIVGRWQLASHLCFTIVLFCLGA